MPRLFLSLSLIVAFVWSFALAAPSCNPLDGSCPPAAGLVTSPYFVDFTQISQLPSEWTIAENEIVTFSGSNGLTFTFNKRYDAPSVWLNDLIFFGEVEVVLQAAPGQGIISASVLQSADLDEIDWEWSGNNFANPSGRVQTNYFGKGIVGNYDRGTQPDVAAPQTEFHNYTLSWLPDSMTWSVDGNVLRTLLRANTDNNTHQYPQSPMRLQLGLWDGGDADQPSGTIQWAGGLTNLSQAPFSMYVKSIKVTNLNPCAFYAYKDKTGSQGSIECVGGGNTTRNASTVTPGPTTTSSLISTDQITVSSNPNLSSTAPPAPPFSSLAATSTHQSATGTASETGTSTVEYTSNMESATTSSTNAGSSTVPVTSATTSSTVTILPGPTGGSSTMTSSTGVVVPATSVAAAARLRPFGL